MGQVISCIKPDPQYDSSTPVVRRKVSASELRRPTTARTQREFQRRAIESIRVAQPPSAEPNMARVEMVETLADDDEIGKRSTLDVRNDVVSKKPKKFTRFADDVIAETAPVNSTSKNVDDKSKLPEHQNVGGNIDSHDLPSPADSKPESIPMDHNIQPENTIEISISSNPTVDADSGSSSGSGSDDAPAKIDESHIVSEEDDSENPALSVDSNDTTSTADSAAQNGKCDTDLEVDGESSSEPTDTMLKEPALTSMPTSESGNSQTDAITQQPALSIPNEQVAEEVIENRKTFVNVSPLSTPDRSEDSAKMIESEEEQIIDHFKTDKDTAPQPSLNTTSVRNHLLSMQGNAKSFVGPESRLLSVREGVEMFDPLQQPFELRQLFSRATLRDKDMVFEGPESLTSEELDHIAEISHGLEPLR